MLVYPATDLGTDYKDHPCGEGFMLSNVVMAWIRVQIPEELTRPDPLLSPALAESLSGVPPALVITAGCDPLREDGLRYVQRLRDAGVPVASLHYPGQFHGFVTFDLILHGARDALERIGAALSDAFAAHGRSGRAVKAEQLRPVRRKLTELHFGQLMASRYIFDMNIVLLQRVAGVLGMRRGAAGVSDDLAPRRHRPVLEELS